MVPVQAELNNSNGELKPGMFTELEVLTDRTATAILAIPTSSVVETNIKKLVFVQNKNVFQSVEVTLGQKSGNLVEVKSGLSEGNLIVTQRAPQLYAQSLRGGSKPKEGEEKEGHSEEKEGHSEEKEGHSEEKEAKTSGKPLPLWLVGAAGGGAFGVVAFLAGAFWNNRKTRSRLVTEGNSESDALAQPNASASFTHETEADLDNHKQPTLSTSAVNVKDPEKPRQLN